MGKVFYSESVLFEICSRVEPLDAVVFFRLLELRVELSLSAISAAESDETLIPRRIDLDLEILADLVTVVDFAVESKAVMPANYAGTITSLFSRQSVVFSSNTLGLILVSSPRTFFFSSSFFFSARSFVVYSSFSFLAFYSTRAYRKLECRFL